MTFACIQQLALILVDYYYATTYELGDKHGNANALSHLLVDVPSSVLKAPENVFLMDTLESTPVTKAEIKEWTRRSFL